MTRQSSIWIMAVTSNDDIVLHPISNSCNKVTFSLTPLDCCMRITVCIHRKYGSNVYRIAEHFELFSKLPRCEMVWILRNGRSVPSIESQWFSTVWFDDADFDLIIHIIGGQYTFHGLGDIQCNTPASNTDSVGFGKRVLTRLTKSSVICSYAAVLIKPQLPTKDLSELTIEDPIPTPCHNSRCSSWCPVDFRVHNISYNIPMRGMIWAVSGAEHSDKWCVLDHNITIHQHAPSNISARYTALCYPRAQCDKAGWQEDLLHHIWSAAPNQST